MYVKLIQQIHVYVYMLKTQSPPIPPSRESLNKKKEKRLQHFCLKSIELIHVDILYILITIELIHVDILYILITFELFHVDILHVLELILKLKCLLFKCIYYKKTTPVHY